MQVFGLKVTSASQFMNETKILVLLFIGWYDTHQTNDFASRMAEDLNKLQEGIGEKIGMFTFFLTIFSASLVNAFYHGWELTLVMIHFLQYILSLFYPRDAKVLQKC